MEKSFIELIIRILLYILFIGGLICNDYNFCFIAIGFLIIDSLDEINKKSKEYVKILFFYLHLGYNVVYLI